MLAIALFPMALAPLSELYGRRPIYLISVTTYTLLFIPQCLTRNFAGFAVARFWSGAACSVANSMVSGSVTDLYPAGEWAEAARVCMKVW